MIWPALQSPSMRRRIIYIAVPVMAVYVLVFRWNAGEYQVLLRIAVALAPLFLMDSIRAGLSDSDIRWFWKLYLVVLLVPITICVLQLLWIVDYYDYGMAYGLYPGRISGGYIKPNNLNAILFPAFLLGLDMINRGRKAKGMALAGFVFLVVIVSGLRTSVISYAAVIAASLIPVKSNGIILRGFRYGAFVAFGVVSFFVLSFSRGLFGLIEGLRLRLPMWMVQAEYYFHSGWTRILFGNGSVHLPAEAATHKIASLTEVHNNDFRIIVTFGLAGYILYGWLLRDVALRIESTPRDSNKFLQTACLIHLLLYSVTNEPVFYPGVAWPLTAWILLSRQTDETTSQ